VSEDDQLVAEIRKLVSDAQGLWGSKAVVLVGTWVILPIFAGLEINEPITVFYMILVSIAIIWGNIIVDPILHSDAGSEKGSR